ncbi:MAG: hypothetical protein ACP5JJ_10640 [Anaerolineae bacterium]
MRNRLITVTAVALALVGWWGLYELTDLVGPDQSGALYMFFALLFLAVTATLLPAALYLNQRLAPAAIARDPLRFFRQSAWGGIAVGISAWLQMHRVFNLGFALVIVLIFVAVEVLIVRLRAEA